MVTLQCRPQELAAVALIKNTWQTLFPGFAVCITITDRLGTWCCTGEGHSKVIGCSCALRDRRRMTKLMKQVSYRAGKHKQWRIYQY